MNYADQATELWGQHLYLKARIADMTRRNKVKAARRVERDLASGRTLDSANREILEAMELKRLNSNDILRSNLIDEDIFVRAQHDSLCLRAIMLGQQPTPKETK